MNSTKCLRSYILLAGLRSLLPRAGALFFSAMPPPRQPASDADKTLADDVWDLPAEIHTASKPSDEAAEGPGLGEETHLKTRMPGLLSRQSKEVTVSASSPATLLIAC